jgi:GntR family transcriptional regulator
MSSGETGLPGQVGVEIDEDGTGDVPTRVGLFAFRRIREVPSDVADGVATNRGRQLVDRDQRSHRGYFSRAFVTFKCSITFCYHGPAVLLRLDTRSDLPIYAQIIRAIRSQIEAGSLRPGTQLPSARSLAVSLNINLHTVLRAYSELQTDGLVEMRRGRGGVVVVGGDALASQVRRLVEAARRSGVTRDRLTAMVEEAWS